MEATPAAPSAAAMEETTAVWEKRRLRSRYLCLQERGVRR